ncbi:hypothetical protein C8Q70DRAFT_687696 [Cubamyces menziesii]|nr:hypothetical protein C8Q70DRAFT_687696 [Cubamyces menziesii]
MHAVNRICSRFRASSSHNEGFIHKLPENLLLACLLLLDAPDLVEYRQICRHWRSLIDSDKYLQFKIGLWAEGLLDGLDNTMGVDAQSKLLCDYKARWKDAQFLRDLDCIQVGPDDIRARKTQSSIDGSVMYMLPAGHSPRLVVCSPPSTLRRLEKRVWTLPLADIEGNIFRIAVDVSQDLLLVAEAPSSETQWDIQLHLLSLENGGRRHPQAASPVIRPLRRPTSGRERHMTFVYALRICGHHVAWIVNSLGLSARGRLDLEVWNWRTGRTVWARTLDKYSFTFLDPLHIALVNLNDLLEAPRTLQIYTIAATGLNEGEAVLKPIKSGDPSRICSLQLPPLRRKYSSRLRCEKIVCNAHSPTAHSAFEPDPGSALLTIHLQVDSVGFILVIPLWALRREKDRVLARPSYLRRRTLSWSEWGPRCGMMLPLAHTKHHAHSLLLRDLEAFGPRLGLLPDFRERNPESSGQIILMDFSRTPGPSAERVRYTNSTASELLQSVLAERGIWSRYFSDSTMRSTLPCLVTAGPDVSLPKWDGGRTAVAKRLVMQPDGFTLVYQRKNDSSLDAQDLRFDTYYV